MGREAWAMTSDHRSRVEVTPERLRQGARNAASCMGIHASDRVFIITDDARADLAGLVATACVERGAATPTVRRLEEYGTRPLTVFPDTLRTDIAAGTAHGELLHCHG